MINLSVSNDRMWYLTQSITNRKMAEAESNPDKKSLYIFLSKKYLECLKEKEEVKK